MIYQVIGRKKNPATITNQVFSRCFLRIWYFILWFYILCWYNSVKLPRLVLRWFFFLLFYSFYRVVYPTNLTCNKAFEISSLLKLYLLGFVTIIAVFILTHNSVHAQKYKHECDFRYNLIILFRASSIICIVCKRICFVFSFLFCFYLC